MEKKINKNPKQQKIYNHNNNFNQIKTRKDPNDERQIKSKTGKYNLDFIDWNNEHERVSEIMQKIEDGEKVEDKNEERRIRNYMNKENEKNGIDEKIEFETVNNPDINKECYICLKNFSRKRIVKKVFCGHMFCEECLLPWIKYHHTCPICKYEFPNKIQKEEEEKENNFEYDNFDI